MTRCNHDETQHVVDEPRALEAVSEPYVAPAPKPVDRMIHWAFHRLSPQF
ncbi:MAG: hypothetical protein JXQ75_18200 [Phycisphaerae bacterium]|nr:hypothetical protein [Phycisphaerae bacterium]